MSDEESAVHEALGQNNSGSGLRALRLALEFRQKAVERDLAAAGADAERARLKKRIREMERQIAVLKEEEAINRFVEASVRVALRNTGRNNDEDMDA